MLESVDGVQECDVDLEKGTATCVVAADTDPEDLVAALRQPYRAVVKR